MAEAKLDTEIRREQIATAALNLVATRGLRAMSIAALARRVGLVPSGIYRHFKNKDEILAAVFDEVERRLAANVRAAREENADPIECLRGVLMRHIRFIREGRAIPRIIFSDDVHAGSERRRDRIHQLFTRYIAQVGEIVREGQLQGRIRQDVDAQTVAMMLFGIVVPAGLLWHLTDGGFDVTRHAERAWRMFCTGVTVSAKHPVSDECE